MRVSAERLSYRYPGATRPVLDDLSCELPAGSTTAIVGPSGSGKTTLMALLGGLLAPQAGAFACVGRDGRRFAPRDVSTWVLQTVSLLPDRSVEDNVRIGAYLDGVDTSTARDRARAALTDMGLGDRASDRAGLLSGGEAQRVAIARALACSRPVLFADEPTGQLDARTTDLVLDALLAGARRTLVLVTHDARAASRCDRVLVLEDGRLRDASTTAG